MYAKALVTTGFIAGFALAAWTPLGTMDVPARSLPATITTLIKDTLLPKKEPGLKSFAALIGAARQEPGGNILQNNTMLLATGFFDPEEAWAMTFSELGQRANNRLDGLTAANWTDTSSSLPKGTAPLTGVPDMWYSQASTAELARLRATLARIRSENKDIKASLKTLDEDHPDHHMARCIHRSNHGLLAFYDFLVTMGESGVTLENTGLLTSALEDERKRAAKHAAAGHRAVALHQKTLTALPAASARDEHIKARALEYYDSFALSFDLEVTLAVHLADYPPLIEEAIRSGNPPRDVSRWVADFQELGRTRMELQAYRQMIAQDLGGPVS